MNIESLFSACSDASDVAVCMLGLGFHTVRLFPTPRVVGLISHREGNAIEDVTVRSLRKYSIS